MRIAIVVYSQTGNTLSAARKLEKKLSSRGHSVKLEQIKVIGDPKRGAANVSFEGLPRLDNYDGIVLASWVEAFRLNQIMRKYLEELPRLDGKRGACMITKALRWKWTGGNSAAKAMKTTMESRGANVISSEIISWKSKTLEKDIDDACERLSRAF
ncbi:MAG: flavodoxin family protein [Thermoplasmatota archaeon]